jgi:ADP-heptose:LPS heptosyltransferase
MKILVTQLTRLGDIFQTWPVLRAIQRNHPEAEIHFLVRSRFAAAAEGLEGIHLRVIDFKEILSPLIDSEPQIKGSMQGLRESLDALARFNFDQVINLTFSPFTA